MSVSHSNLPKPNSRAAACWATLITSEHLLPGLAVFSHSLLVTHRSQYPLVVMCTPDFPSRARRIVEALGCKVAEVQPIYPKQRPAKTLAYSRFSQVWTKLRAFELVDYQKVVLVDSDMLVRKNMDELFKHRGVFPPSSSLLPSHEDERRSHPQSDEDVRPMEDSIAASFACTCNPNKIASYPDDWTHKLLNSGLVVLKPSCETMSAMIEKIDTDPRVPEYRFPDQDFLADWYEGRLHILPWCYNALKKLRLVHPNIWRDDEVRNVHYILE
ncbi:nucleotide-diphospho-sugar transferase [Violaceomyces palustris]|uniref:Nucleotide-diphospho-sugar transferase n=1 Tax=Violaceomyces palustris TaxID=1673888 RepID=A0ACD0NTH2_9BASI|nr:nucleotide-diphospho-sugar transferase [Violaceomyces palustris]